MNVTLNVFVKDSAGNPVTDARVAIITKNAAILPATRYTQGDGGCNLYYEGPPFDPPLEVDVMVDAAGFKPFCTAASPILFGASSIDYPVILSFKRPPVNLRDWRGAFVIPDALPGIPYGDGRRIWTPAFGCYDGNWQAQILGAFVARGYTHFPYNCAGWPYHTDYPYMDDDPARVRRDLLKIRAAGVVPVVCACDDQDGGSIVPWRSFSENADLIQIDFPMWEMNGPLGVATYNGDGTFSGRIVECIQNTRNAAPKADTYLHFTAGHGSIGTPELEGWAYCKSLGVLGLQSQDAGFDRDPTTGDPEGTAAGLADTAMRLGTLGLLNVAFEQCTTPVYYHWAGWDETHQRNYGAYLVDHAAGIAGFCDGGPK